MRIGHLSYRGQTSSAWRGYLDTWRAWSHGPSKYPASPPLRVLGVIFWTIPLIALLTPPCLVLLISTKAIVSSQVASIPFHVFSDCMHQWFRKCLSPAGRRSPSSETISRAITAIKSHITSHHCYQVTHNKVSWLSSYILEGIQADPRFLDECNCPSISFGGLSSDIANWKILQNAHRCVIKVWLG